MSHEHQNELTSPLTRKAVSRQGAAPLLIDIASIPAAATPALRALAVRHRAAVRAVEQCDSALSAATFNRLIGKECDLARLIALRPAASLDDLFIKAVVALREMGLRCFKMDEPFDCEAARKAIKDQGEIDIIDAAIILDVLRLTGKSVTS